MSDYCSQCRYDVKQRTGPNACPFNALYWDFLARNREVLGANQRLAMPYRNWDRMDDATRADIRASASRFLDTLG
jgi:deoxyribodipyrimidine photolyase-related protein